VGTSGLFQDFHVKFAKKPKKHKEKVETHPKTPEAWKVNAQCDAATGLSAMLLGHPSCILLQQYVQNDFTAILLPI